MSRFTWRRTRSEAANADLIGPCEDGGEEDVHT